MSNRSVGLALTAYDSAPGKSELAGLFQPKTVSNGIKSLKNALLFYLAITITT